MKVERSQTEKNDRRKEIYMAHVHGYQERRRNMQKNEEDGNVIPHQCK